MDIRLTVEGIAGLNKALASMSKEIEAGLALAVEATGLDLMTGVKKRIQRGPKTGKVYRRGKGQNLSATHQASAPGQSPATDIGDLASSVYFTMDGKIEGTAGSRLPYAEWLEFGTVNIKPRPAWVPEVERLRPKLQKRAEAVIKRAST